MPNTYQVVGKNADIRPFMKRVFKTASRGKQLKLKVQRVNFDELSLRRGEQPQTQTVRLVVKEILLEPTPVINATLAGTWVRIEVAEDGVLFDVSE